MTSLKKVLVARLKLKKLAAHDLIKGSSSKKERTGGATEENIRAAAGRRKTIARQLKKIGGAAQEKTRGLT